MALTIEEALAQFDPNNDEQWTSDGLPRMVIVEELTENPGLNRADVVNADPTFNRQRLLDEQEQVQQDEQVEQEEEEENQEPTEEEVLGSRTLLQERIANLDKQIVAKQKEANNIEEEIKQLSNQSQYYDNVMRSLEPDPEEVDPFTAYIETNQRVKEERAAKREQLLGALSVGDLTKQIDTKAPIDKKKRKKIQGLKHPVAGTE